MLNLVVRKETAGFKRFIVKVYVLQYYAYCWLVCHRLSMHGNECNKICCTCFCLYDLYSIYVYVGLSTLYWVCLFMYQRYSLYVCMRASYFIVDFQHKQGLRP